MKTVDRTTGTREAVHATCLELSCNGLNTAVLLLGPSASGKSSLALRLIDQPGFGASGKHLITASLISDDQTRLEICNGQLTASVPEKLAGLLEVHGQGIVCLKRFVAKPVPVGFVIRHRPLRELDRSPEPAFAELASVKIVTHFLDFHSHSAAATVRTLALMHWKQLALSVD
jgi:serine kinase of HPr protein (carbohydrate metabolism regulator)